MGKVWYITLPLLTPTILYDIIIGIGLGLQVFVPAYIMTGGGPLNSTMFTALYIYKNAFEYSQVGLAAAVSGILFVINAVLAVITFWSSKYWVNYHLQLEDSVRAITSKGPAPSKAPRQLLSRFFLIGTCLFYISPMYWMLVTALKSDKELAQFPPTLWPQEIVWRNFFLATRTFPFLPYLENTIFYAALTMLGSVLSNFVIAYGFSRIKWPGRDLVFYPVIASIFIFIQFPVNPITMVPMFSFFAQAWVSKFLSATGLADLFR